MWKELIISDFEHGKKVKQGQLWEYHLLVSYFRGTVSLQNFTSKRMLSFALDMYSSKL